MPHKKTFKHSIAMCLYIYRENNSTKSSYIIIIYTKGEYLTHYSTVLQVTTLEGIHDRCRDITIHD